MHELPFFPTPYDDEDFRSLHYRFAKMASMNNMDSSESLFGTKNRKYSLFPTNLASMMQKIPGRHNYNIDYMLEHHTFFPLCRLFLHPSKQVEIRSDLSYKNVGSLYNLHFIHEWISKSIRYCPICIHEDYEVKGVMYIHRLHQLQPFNLCYKHGIELVTHCPVCKSVLCTPVTQLYMPICEHCKNTIKINKPHESLVKSEITIRSQELMVSLFRGSSIWNSTEILNRILIAIGNKGYIHFKGMIQKRDLINEILQHFSSDDLNKLGIRTEGMLKQRFLTQFLDNSKMHLHISVYLLMILLLFKTAEGLYNYADGFAVPLPFGVGPWECKNVVCPEYGEKSIMYCKRYVHEYISGTFTCPNCLYTYSKSGKHGKEENEQHFNIESYGPLWMDKVIELRKQGLTQDEIATVVGASDVTIRKHLQIYSKLREKQDHPFERYVDSFAEKRKIQYRVYIEQALSQEYLVSSRREIRKSNHFKYDWLMKHDREWMEEHLPPRVPNKKKISNHDELDAEMVALLKLAIEKVYATNSVRQICKNTILKKVPKECSSRLSRITNECFYPKSFQLLMNAIETSEHYLKRIFPVMVQRFEQSRYHLLSFQILCNFKKGYRKCEGELREWVEENIRLYINNPSLITLKEN